MNTFDVIPDLPPCDHGPEHRTPEGICFPCSMRFIGETLEKAGLAVTSLVAERDALKAQIAELRADVLCKTALIHDLRGRLAHAQPRP